MNYYKRHIGDYMKDASHLSLLEHGVYTRLMDVYYTREAPVPVDQAARLIGARSKDEKAALSAVVSEFFQVVEGCYVQNRCDKEIVDARESMEENEAKKENEKERQRRHRSRRKELFEQLRGHGIVPKWDFTTEQLETELSRSEKRDRNAPVTRTATAIHKPIATNHPVPNGTGSVPIGTDADGVVEAKNGNPPKPPKPPNLPAEVAKAELWRAAVSVLEQGGCPPSQCRTFMGKLVTDFSFSVVKDAVAAAVSEQPADAREYLKATCQHAAGQRQRPNRQEALEARNRAIAEEMIAEQGAQIATV